MIDISKLRPVVLRQIGPPEIERICAAAAKRQEENEGRRQGHKGAAANGEAAYRHHILGCAGEFIVSDVLEIEWVGKGKFRDSDVGDGIDLEVKTTLLKALHSPIWPVRSTTTSDTIVCVLKHTSMIYELVGWIYVSKARQVADMVAPDPNRPADLFFGQEHLEPMDTLPIQTPCKA